MLALGKILRQFREREKYLNFPTSYYLCLRKTKWQKKVFVTDKKGKFIGCPLIKTA